MSHTHESTSGVVLYRRLLTYVSPYWRGFGLAIFGMVLVAASEPGFAALIKPMLDGSFIQQDPFLQKLIPLAIAGVFIVRGVGGFLVKYFMEWVGRSIIRDLRSEMFTHLIALPATFYDQSTKGHLTSKLIYDVEQVASAATNAITSLIRDTLTIIALLSWMVYLSWKLTLFFLIVTPVIGITIGYVSKRFRRYSRRIQASMGDVSQITQQVIESNRVVKIYGGETYETNKFNEVNNFNRKQNLKMAATGAANTPVTQFFAAIALVGVLYFATNQISLGAMTVGTFMSFVTASMLLLNPLKKLTQINEQLQKGITAANSVFTLLMQSPEQDQGQKILENIRGEVIYDNVSFAYNNNKTKVLNGISLKVNPGQTIAIVGRSGSGKSTLVSLLPRFYDITEGEIFLDGTPIKELKLSELRKYIALVSQDVTLFNDTIANNIAYAQSGDVKIQDITEVASAAHAMEFINQLPDGLDTIVGDKGVLLSGGQRQRIAIARALLKNAPILILDEATSALDTESERYIQDGLNRLMSGRTTLVIAHRLSTIENADKIIVLDNGKIIEQGSHAELLALGAQYAALHSMQFKDAPLTVN